MFNVNLLNKPGNQDENTTDESFFSDVQIGEEKERIIIKDDSELLNSPNSQSEKIDLFSIIIIILIIGIIISVLIGYYLKFL